MVFQMKPRFGILPVGRLSTHSTRGTGPSAIVSIVFRSSDSPEERSSSWQPQCVACFFGSVPLYSMTFNMSVFNATSCSSNQGEMHHLRLGSRFTFAQLTDPSIWRRLLVSMKCQESHLTAPKTTQLEASHLMGVLRYNPSESIAIYPKQPAEPYHHLPTGGRWFALVENGLSGTEESIAIYPKQPAAYHLEEGEVVLCSCATGFRTPLSCATGLQPAVGV